MKKVFFTVLLAIGLNANSNAKTIELTQIEKHEIVINDSSIVKKQKVIFPGLAFMLAHVTYCAQVQMDVAAAYHDTLGPERANSISLGAFMGCMGYL